jgi:predicted Holliday junction resolvase-like endonuclease
MVIGMATAIVFLWRHNVSLNKQLREMEADHRAQLQAVQDKRVQEAIEVRKELMGLAEDFNKAVHELGSLIVALKDAVLLRDRDR